jgi:hypothetical protein
MFTPPSLKGTVLFPGNIGGSNWGGVAVDPVRGLAITPTNRLATIVRLVPRAGFEAAAAANRDWQATPQRGTPYGMMRQTLRAPGGLPCNPPPWGTLTAVDLTGEIKWEVPLGAFEGQADSLGATNLGGAMITAGGLVFVAGTPDRHLRAFDVATGKTLWSDELPAAGNAMPMTYVTPNGRQFVVIAAGGRPPLWRQGDYVIAYAIDATGPLPSGDVTGRWDGELLIGSLRLRGVKLAMQRSADGIGGTFHAAAPRVDGTVRGLSDNSPDGVAVRISFENFDERCSGTAEGLLSLANAGDLLVGELRITGGCSDGVELAALAVRRPRP